MRVLTAWTGTDPEAARRAESGLGTDPAHGLLTVDDGAHVSWPQRRRGPTVRGLEDVPLTAAVGAGFWGLLFATLFAGPALSALARTDGAVLDEVLTGVGVGADFLTELRSALGPGSSALVLLSEAPTARAVDAVVSRWCPHRVETVLDEARLTALRTVFAF